MTKTDFIQGSLFEEDFLVRTLGNLVTQPEVALTELVANAWDAGATEVDIFIPEERGQLLTIIDNGAGLTKDEFYNRWMKLSYNRLKHQGKMVEFPTGVNLKRFAYGRNGIGRHGLLCFNNEYKVITNKNGIESTFMLTTQSEDQPFIAKSENLKKSVKAGTRLEVVVQKNLPVISTILQEISARFLHDPKFIVSINKQTIDLEDHMGLVDTVPVTVDEVNMKVNLIDSKKSRKSTLYQGIAFWQGGRLVGEPSWILGNTMVLDGRSKEAKRYSVVVETTDLGNYIKGDWTGFKRDGKLDAIFLAITDVVQQMFLKIAAENIGETTKNIKAAFKKEYYELSPLGKYEFNEAIEHISANNPGAKEEAIALAIETVINLEKTRSGHELLVKLSHLSGEDIIGLNKLLENWSIKDALTVLDEIDKRISVIEAIRKLSGDPTVNELQVLHPLITSARWIFGPEYDSPEFSSNSQLQTTVQKLFGKKLDKSVFLNNKKRPDIVVMGQSTFSITGTTDYDHQNGLSSIKKILIIELKRGGFKIGRDERSQAVNYVEDFVGCGTLIGSPYINAFVVGESYKENVQPIQNIVNENGVEIGKVQICLFSQIVDSSERRLFNLRERLKERYADVSGTDLFLQQQKMAI
ncbi:MAG: ATP-binding protein [Pedobacter sp.]